MGWTHRLGLSIVDLRVCLGRGGPLAASPPVRLGIGAKVVGIMRSQGEWPCPSRAGREITVNGTPIYKAYAECGGVAPFA